MKEFKVVHVSDLHFGLTTFGAENPKTSLNTRTEDIFNAFSQCVDFCIDNSVDVCIISGDIFHTKAPTQQVINEFYKYIKKLSDSNCYIYILAGNHDESAHTPKKSSLDIPNTLKLDNIFSTKGDGDILDLGYLQLYSPNYWDSNEVLMEKINNAADKIDFNRPAILVAHLQTETPTFKVGGAFEDLHIVPLQYLISHPWNYVALGHIHCYQKLHDNPPVYYASSLARISFAEENDTKGFNLITFKNNKVSSIERIPVDCLKMLTITGTMEDLKSQLEKVKPSKFKNTIVRIVIEKADETVDEKFFKDKFTESFKFLIKKQPNKIEHKKIDTQNLLSLHQYAERYFDNHPKQKKLLEMTDEIKSIDEAKLAI